MRRRVCVVTGSRAEFGLLRPVMDAISKHPELKLQVVVAGSHFLPPDETYQEVDDRYKSRVVGRVRMQDRWHASRSDDAIALGKGVQGLAEAFARLKPEWVVVLGDRIEAMAAACAASVGGWALAHIHGGDRAEGIADEAMRHAITKLAHLHLAASAGSAARIARMGEGEDRIVVIGSPAIDGLDAIAPVKERNLIDSMGIDPIVMILLHPCGLGENEERMWARAVSAGVAASPGTRHGVAWCWPNHDAGHQALRDAICEEVHDRRWVHVPHLPRERFIALLKRLALRDGVLVGNSSAGLIECAALGVRVVNVGSRQNGRERAGNVVDVATPEARAVAEAIAAARALDLSGLTHPYGDGKAGVRAEEALAGAAAASPGFLRKCNAY